ncbi:hypothetical protein MSAN_01614600 [Mycena sanguinolenta]|uniref:Uncharacterized protein n=1 Tax=Mycena sanguinolenta TaxID=230812 RepID=A0A8H6XYB3_9AGAR|nr:hypothetical protein MSAN_01614600 [Mycena sanguinolenta]
MSTAPTTSASTSTFLYRLGLLTMTLALGYLAKVFRHTKYTTKKAQEDLLVLRKAIESRDTEISSLHRSVEAVKEDARDREEGLAHEIAELQGRLRATEGELAEASEGKRTLEEALTDRNVQEKEWMAEKTRLEAEHQDILDVLETKSAELANAQRASLMVRGDDRLTDQAVLLLVQQLNRKITETAAELADAFEFEEKKEKDALPESEEMVEVHERATEILGHELVDILRTADHHEDPALVRLAFQSGMIEYARWMSASWFFEDPEDEQLLADIYQRVRMAHDQVVAGRWRSLTHAHVQELIHGEPELGDYFVDAYVNVLLTAGFKSSSAALHELVSQRFADRIAMLVQLALGLNKAIGAEVTACELKTLSAAPGVPFDEETMIDIVDAAPPTPGEAVLCTCELGLSRSDKIDGTWTRTILQKPKVVLPSGLEELLGRTPTRTQPGVFPQTQ